MLCFFPTGGLSNSILIQTNSDMTRFVRKLKSVIGTEYQEEFLAEQKEIAGHISDMIGRNVPE